jgi:hypothetical protein
LPIDLRVLAESILGSDKSAKLVGEHSTDRAAGLRGLLLLRG